MEKNMRTISNIKTVLCAGLLAAACYVPAHAAHSSYSPMAPRQISMEASSKDYSYGLTLLPGNSIDSIEPLGRNVAWFINYNVLDRYMLRPLAHGYSYLPQPVQDGFGNFFFNLSEINNTLNNVLIGEFADGGISFARLLINSTIGLLGFIDVASYMGIERHRMAMGTALGRMGADQGAYVLLLGPNTMRNLHGSTIDNMPRYLWLNGFVSLGLSALETVHDRAQLIGQEEMVDNAIDPYAQVRQIYLMFHEGKVNPDKAVSTEQTVDESYMDEID